MARRVPRAFPLSALLAVTVVGCGDASDDRAASNTDGVDAAAAAGSGGGPGDAGPGDATAPLDAGGTFVDANVGESAPTPTCEAPPTPAGTDVVLAPEYAGLYTAYELGPVPGVPNPLGGCVVKHDDPNTLLIAGASERPDGAIYSIRVERGPCGHILGFEGTAALVAQTPYVDANLVYAPGGLLFYSQWPQYKISQIPAGGTTSSRDTDLTLLGIQTTQDRGPGGIGFVPAEIAAAGQMRIVTWPAGLWYHVGLAPDGPLYQVTSLTETTQLPNNPGGFAYVPAGSPGFDAQSLIVAEWVQGNAAQDAVATYEVDDEGDPIPSTRKPFFTTFPRPWGAYFEPVTGDYLFLTWGTGNDRVFIVQGFVPPPPAVAPPR